MIGPSGYGSSNFVSDNENLPYTIDFENAPTATAPAQEVTITDQLSSDLNWNTFELTAIGWGDFNLMIPAGSEYYQTMVPMTYNGETFDVEVTAGIHTATGELYATFLSIDPSTGLPPDVLTGFLPPEDGTGRGMGYISYSVKPVTGLPTGTPITNVADISFDGQPIVATDQVDDDDPTQGISQAKMAMVTIDSVPPTSTISPLPSSETNPDFPVQWSGTDDAGGSGVASYSIYVSDNGGTFAPWLTNTTATSGTYDGVPGNTYGFYSIATDNVGNVQPTPAAAQQSVVVIPSDVWMGTQSNSWSNPANWSSGTVPTGTSNVTINSGTVVVDTPFTVGILSIGGGTLRLASGGSTANVSGLYITGTGTLDLGNNELIINYGSNSDPISTIAGLIKSGYNGGAWDGAGIISSAAQLNPNYGIGYADAADAGNPANLPAGEIKIMYTLLGDANLDGTVNSEDFTLFSHNLGQSGMSWDDGDFNYDGTVNSEDFTLLSDNLGKAAILNPAGLVPGTGAEYTITGSPGAQTLDILSGTVTLTSDLSALLPNYSLQIENGANVVLASDQHIGALQLVGSGSLDVSNYTMFIKYGSNADPISTIAGLIKSGYNGGAWNGTGIFSSAAAVSKSYGLGYSDSADPGNPAALPSGTIEIKYTLLGDANLDGTVNSEDFTLFSEHLGKSGMMWDEGDFNYDGTVNSEDFTLLSENLGQSATQSAVAFSELAAISNNDADVAPVATVVASISPTVTTFTAESTVTPTITAPTVVQAMVAVTVVSTTATTGSNDLVMTVLGKYAKKKKSHQGEKWTPQMRFTERTES